MTKCIQLKWLSIEYQLRSKCSLKWHGNGFNNCLFSKTGVMLAIRAKLSIIDFKSPTTKILSKVLLNKMSVLLLRYKMSKVKDSRNSLSLMPIGNLMSQIK